MPLYKNSRDMVWPPENGRHSQNKTMPNKIVCKVYAVAVFVTLKAFSGEIQNAYDILMFDLKGGWIYIHSCLGININDKWVHGVPYWNGLTLISA